MRWKLDQSQSDELHSGRSIKSSKNLVGTIIEAGVSFQIRKLLERHPSISSSDEIEEIDLDMQAVTTEVRTTKTNTIISIPFVYPGESYPPVNPENRVMSVITRNC